MFWLENMPKSSLRVEVYIQDSIKMPHQILSSLRISDLLRSRGFGQFADKFSHIVDVIDFALG